MQSLFQILMLLLDVVWFCIIAHVIMSWLINFQVLNLRQPLVSQIWYGLNRLLEPIYRPIRNILLFSPDLGLLLVSGAATGVAWAALRLLLAHAGRSAPASTGP